jgi:lipopolysaccharide/colanic/teichoic acid biosynthesis glycosyltransferase
VNRITRAFEIAPTPGEQRVGARSAMNYLTRAFEIILSGAALVVLSPIFLVISISIKLESAGNIIFCQPRVGWRGRPFRMYKFRTLYDPKYRPRPHVPPPQTPDEAKYRRDFCCEECARPMDECLCITGVGRLLRRTNLDELPQLWNVLRGEMTFVGPRPTLEYQVDQYSARQRARLDLRPGITGWAQVSGRNALTWDEKIELDLWYLNNRSLSLDCKILFRTLGSRGA